MTSTHRCGTFAVTLVLLSICGCAMVNPKPDYDRAGKTIADATGSDSYFRPGEDDVGAKRVRELLQAGITCDQAVQICLLNNPSLQAAFLEIGFARADVVQSSLFSNPSLALSVAFPEGGGRSNIQATFAQNIVDLWQIPIRKRSSQRLLDAAILDVARQASQLAVDTRSAYFTAVAADQALVIAKENVVIAEQLLDAAKARQQAGAVGELDVNLARGAVYSAELEMQRARLDAGTSRRRLAILLGLTEAAEDLHLATNVLLPPLVELDSEQIVQIALSSRLDIQSLRMESEAKRQRINLEIAKILPEFSIGFYEEQSERRALKGRKIRADTARASVAAGALTAPEIQSRGQRSGERSQIIDNIFGPAFNLTLPIFDQNQAQIAKARLAYEQSALQLDALEKAVMQAVRQGVDAAQTARKIAEYYHEKMLPQAQSNLDLSRQTYQAGRASLIVLLDAQRILLATRRDAVVADRESAITRAELERLTARPLTTLLESGSPTSQPVVEATPEFTDPPASTRQGLQP
ncbi:MAG: TolC family protein [Planctomycetes bacterium]|nr:TolC family protein [Planctomycetota bacterium]